MERVDFRDVDLPPVVLALDHDRQIEGPYSRLDKHVDLPWSIRSSTCTPRWTVTSECSATNCLTMVSTMTSSSAPGCTRERYASPDTCRTHGVRLRRSRTSCVEGWQPFAPNCVEPLSSRGTSRTRARCVVDDEFTGVFLGVRRGELFGVVQESRRPSRRSMRGSSGAHDPRALPRVDTARCPPPRTRPTDRHTRHLAGMLCRVEGGLERGTMGLCLVGGRRWRRISASNGIATVKFALPSSLLTAASDGRSDVLSGMPKITIVEPGGLRFHA